MTRKGLRYLHSGRHLSRLGSLRSIKKPGLHTFAVGKPGWGLFFAEDFEAAEASFFGSYVAFDVVFASHYVAYVDGMAYADGVEGQGVACKKFYVVRFVDAESHVGDAFEFT